MAAPIPSLSYASSSGVQGDIESTSPVNQNYSSPFAVGSGASSSASAAAGSADVLKVALYVGGALVLIVGVVVAVKVSKPSKP